MPPGLVGGQFAALLDFGPLNLTPLCLDFPFLVVVHFLLSGLYSRNDSSRLTGWVASFAL